MPMYKEIDAVQFDKILHTKDEVEIIDVREKNEWDMINIPKAKLIPLSEISYRVNEIDFWKNVYIFCRSWARSWRVCSWLETQWKSATNVAWSIRWLYEIKSDILNITDKFYPWYL